jgi:CBS domain containing-hemolysin-like protein
MTPRPVVFMLPKELPIADFARQIEKKPFSRIPITAGGADQVEGMVLRSEVLLAAVKGRTGTLEDLKRPVQAIPAAVHVDHLFETMLSESHHLMMVEDEFGTTVGLVTLEDVLETVVGVEIVDEHDQVADLQAVARRLWKARAARMGLSTDFDPPSETGTKTAS